MRSRASRVIGWGLLALASLFFAWNGIQKLIGAPEMVELFETLGQPAWLRYVVGSIELAGAIGLVVPRLTMLAATVLGGLMVGAAVAEMTAGRTFEAQIPLQWIAFFAGVVWVRRRHRRVEAAE